MVAVEHLAAVLSVELDDVGHAAAGGALGELVHELAGVVGAEALVDEVLGVDMADVATVPTAAVAAVVGDEGGVGLPLDDGHAHALVDGGKRRRKAGVAAAQDDDVELACVGDLRLVDLGSDAEPVAGAAIARNTRGRRRFLGGPCLSNNNSRSGCQGGASNEGPA